MVNLSVAEARVLGALIEKEITTPEYYPLSLNALVNACNQKSNREPVTELSEAEVRSALFEMEPLSLVRVLAEGRVSKFEHRAYDGLGVKRPEIAVLGLLLLRGPQTAAELRARAERLYSFEDTAAVTTTLDRLAARDEPMVRQMPRQPGSRESRWVHLLGGPVEALEPGAAARGGAAENVAAPSAALGEMEERLAFLEEAVQRLEERLAGLEGEREMDS